MDTLSVQISRAVPGDPEVEALIAAHIALANANYPPESCHAYDAAKLAELGVTLFVGHLNGRAVAIGGFLVFDGDAAEMKSVYTASDARGRGFGRLMAAHLMAEAKAAGCTRMYLETGNDAPSAAARAVYVKLGFEECGPFGPYGEDPLSAYMTAEL